MRLLCKWGLDWLAGVLATGVFRLRARDLATGLCTRKFSGSVSNETITGMTQLTELCLIGALTSYKAKVQKVPQTEAFVSLTRCCISAKAENLIIDCLWVIIFFFCFFSGVHASVSTVIFWETSFSSFIAKLTYIINLNLRYLWGKKKKTIIMWM